MNVAMLSFFRNSAGGQLQRYLQQAADLRDALKERGDTLRLISVWGDCTDLTSGLLLSGALMHNLSMHRVERSHGGPVYGSIVSDARFKALSFIGNGGLDQVLPSDDVVIYVESDLIWNPDTMLHLLGSIREGVDVVAPMIFAENNRFYDIYVYRKDGVAFSGSPPYHKGLKNGGSLTPVDSAGSCLVMRGEVARTCRMTDHVLIGFCADAWSRGYTVNVDASQTVRHP